MRALLAVAALTVVSPALAGPTPDTLKKVATFPHQVTGVAVSAKGRIFVSFPRWSEDAPISVAEVDPRSGKLTPYPDAAWNAWRHAGPGSELSPGEHFVCVQAVYADAHDHLWVVDAASPGQKGVVPNGAKLVEIDLATNRVGRIYPFDDRVALPNSYANDIRLATDGKTAFVTDSGKPGAIIVVDLALGRARRALDNLGPADGLALSPDGATLYYQRLHDSTLFAVPTADLVAGKSPRAHAVGANVAADGLWISPRTNRMYITSPADNSIYARDLGRAGDAGKPYALLEDPRLRWPDTFAEGPDGKLYITASHLQDAPPAKGGPSTARTTELFVLTPL